jgi:hypothetical protein
MPSLVRAKQQAVVKKKTKTTVKKTRKKTTKTPRKPTEKLRVRTRGKYRNVVYAGTSLRGMHPTLMGVISHLWNYDEAVANNTLQKENTPPGDVEVIPRSSDVKNKSKLQNSKRLGQRLDTQVASIVRWHTGKYKVPLKAFFDAGERNKFVKIQWGTPPVGKEKEYEKERKRFRNVCNGMMNETEQLIRYLHQRKYDPVGTQVPVHWNKSLGTPIDLVVIDMDGRYRTIELKKGCEKSFSHGKKMSPVYPDRTFSTHNEYLLQTMMNDRLYRKTHPGRIVGPPMMIRIPPNSLHVYKVPAWAYEHEHHLALAMKCE